MIYEVYTTHVYYQETQIKKWTFFYFLKSVNFSNDSFTNSYLWNTVSLLPKFVIVPCNLKNNCWDIFNSFWDKIQSSIRYSLSETWFSQSKKHLAWFLVVCLIMGNKYLILKISAGKHLSPREFGICSLLYSGGSCGALLMDLSKTFDCIVLDLLLAKLSAYCFDYNLLKLINSFLSGRKCETKVGSSKSPYPDLLVGIPQGSILGPFSFNICMWDLFLCDYKSNIINYADSTTLYACELNMDLLLRKLEKGTSSFQNS